MSLSAADARRAGRGMEKRHFAKAIPGAHRRALVTADGGSRGSLLDDEALASRIALAHQDPAGRDFDLGCQGRDPSELPLATGREELHLRKPLDFGIAAPARRSLHPPSIPSARPLRSSVRPPPSCAHPAGLRSNLADRGGAPRSIARPPGCRNTRPRTPGPSAMLETWATGTSSPTGTVHTPVHGHRGVDNVVGAARRRLR